MAVVNDRDDRHRECRHLLGRRRGTYAELAFLSDVREGRYTLIKSLSADRADSAPGIRRVPDLLGATAILVLNGAPSLLQPGEEGIDLGDVTLGEPQLAELGEYQTVEPVAVGVQGGVLAPLGDLRHLYRRSISEPRMRPEQLRTLTPVLTQFVLQRALRLGPRRSPTVLRGESRRRDPEPGNELPTGRRRG